MQLVVPRHKDTKLNVPQLFGKGHRKHRTCILCGPGGTWRQSLRSELLPVRHHNESNFCFEEQTGRCCGQTRTVFKIRAKSFRLSSVKVRQVLCAFGLWRNWKEGIFDFRHCHTETQLLFLDSRLPRKTKCRPSAGRLLGPCAISSEHFWFCHYPRLRTFIGEAGICEPVGAVRGRAAFAQNRYDVALLWIADRQQRLPIDKIDRISQR